MGIDPEESLDRGGVDFQEPGANWVDSYGAVPLGKVKYSASVHHVFQHPNAQVKLLEMCDYLRANEKMTSMSALSCATETQKETNYNCGVRLPKHHCKTGVYCFIDLVK